VLGGSTYRIGNGERQPAPGRSFVVPVTEPISVTIENPKCVPYSLTLDRNSQPFITAQQQFSVATLNIECPRPNGVDASNWKVSISVDGVSATEGPFTVTFDKMTTVSSKTVMVKFSGGRIDASKAVEQKVTVEAAQSATVRCDFNEKSR
jgi:hypothetical protein